MSNEESCVMWLFCSDMWPRSIDSLPSRSFQHVFLEDSRFFVCLVSLFDASCVSSNMDRNLVDRSISQHVQSEKAG